MARASARSCAGMPVTGRESARAAQHRAAQHASLAIEVLGRRMDDDVGTQLEAAAAAQACRSSCRPPAMRRHGAQHRPAPRCRRSPSADWRAFPGTACAYSAVIACSQAATSRAPTTNVVSMPKRGSQLLNSCTVAPNKLRDATMWSPACIKPITLPRMADMPEAVATQHSAPSSAARRSCSAFTVGLV